MLENRDKISNAIQQAKTWLQENKPGWYNPFHRKHNFDEELSALEALERVEYTDEAIKECIRKTGYHKHSFISFLHSEQGAINDQRIDLTSYDRLDSTLFLKKTTEEREEIYSKALDL
ncbi:hypothetical protein [Piscirickettsia litoralis]|uniref:Uncharacterized protein n=1 Tax=Piscirickettsia litoralis TaxID=1891921 RepID=A0ABX2ZZU5_9GAMM|nr:hypothetical protein [Piscirickettsia litoralis]ODN40971.1 hypothetical protein BGC07_18835 [Piscirickettsia litoralis]